LLPTGPDALGNVPAFLGRTTLPAEDPKVARCLLGLLADVECRGKQVHDANPDSRIGKDS